MEKIIKRIISLLLALTIIFGSAAAGLFEVDFAGVKFENPFAVKTKAASSGTCGDNLTWTLDDNGTLTISGTGTMNGYYFEMGPCAPWYNYRYDIKKVIINEGVKSIGGYAFFECGSLTSITIPDSATSIGDYAFYYCYSLTSITILDSVTSIGSYAFSSCYSLTSITIPDSVTSIGSYAFSNTGYYNDSSNWENEVLYIGNHLIEAKTTISGEYAIKEGTKTIGGYAFRSCSSLTSITIPDSVTSIGGYAFFECGSLTSITIPGSVTSIGDYAFDYCYSLTSITILDSVTSIGSYAFSSCYSLTSITIPDSVTSIGSSAFSNTGYYNDSSNWENEVLYIGNHLIEAKTTISGEYAIKEGTKTIGDDAFYDCRILTSITIPDSVTSIGDWAFYYCSSLTSITLLEGVTSIGSSAFRYCNRLTSITIPGSVTSIGDYAFSGCSSLTSITISEGVTRIGDYAFSGCSSLTFITIPDSVTSIGDWAFYYCSSLTSITLLEGVTSIGSSAFRYCNRLTSITIPEGVTSIGSYAFYECTSLTSITIPVSVTSIGSSAFRYCNRLTSITVDSANKSYSSVDGILFNKTQTELIQYPIGKTSTSYTIPDSVTSIGSYAFYECTSLTSITIPDSVTSIGFSAFSDCASLTSITIPDGVTSIGEYAFYGCYSLKYVFFNGTQEEWGAIHIYSGNSSIGMAKIHYEATDHIASEWIVDVEPTCTEAGSKHKECTVCKVVIENAIIEPTGHIAGDWVVEVYSTCSGNGIKYKRCTSCGVVVEVGVVSATGHTASATKYDAVKRLEYKECTVCKVVLESKYIPLGTTTITSCYNEVKGVQLKWNAVTDADKYEIYRKTSSQSSWEKITSTSEIAYQDTSVTGNTVYRYKIKAVDQYGNQSDYSAQRECRFIATPKLKSISNTVGGLTITWEKVAGATSYRIYRRGAGTNYWYYLGDVSSTQNTFFDKESSLVSSGNYYRYTVRASYSGKDSAGKDYMIYSGFDTNGLYLKYVGTPKLTSISNATNGLQIKWNAVSGGKDLKYNVYRRGAGSSSWKYLGSTTGTTWTDSEVKNSSGNYYRYTVRAIDGYYSAFDATGLFLMRLANPTLKSATSAKAGITVKWGSVKGATSYYVYRKTGSSNWTKIATISGNSNVSYLDKTAKKGTTYTYTVRAVYGSTTSYFDAGKSCKDKY